MKASFLRFLRALPLLILAPIALAIVAIALAASDLVWLIFNPRGGRRRPADTRPDTRAASLVIPNWNGRDLLERFLPSWIAAIANHPGSEIVVVDNGSTDGSAAWIAENYPQVRVLALPENRGFGGGSNAGFDAAKNDIVVLLNSDMRVEPDFLAPLLAGFTDEQVFAVSCADLPRRSDETPRRNRPDRRLVAGWRTARQPSRRPGCRLPFPVLLWRRRFLRLRSPQVFRPRRIRRSPRALLP